MLVGFTRTVDKPTSGKNICKISAIKLHHIFVRIFLLGLMDARILSAGFFRTIPSIKAQLNISDNFTR